MAAAIRFDSPEAIHRANAGEPLPIPFVGWCRIYARSAMLVVALLMIVPLHYLFRVVKYGSPFPMWFLRIASRIIGIRVKIHGVPLRRDVFFISNHVSWLDILIIGGCTGCAFVARAELESMRILGWMCRLNRTIFVNRESRRNAAEQINVLREALADNWSVAIFPEGTVTDGHSLLPFKSSMLSVLESPPPGILVQPLVVDYRAAAEWIGWVGEETGIDNARRVFMRPGTLDVDLHFLDPIDPRNCLGRKAITAESRQRIEQVLVASLGKPLRPFRYDMPKVGYLAPRDQPLDSA